MEDFGFSAFCIRMATSVFKRLGIFLEERELSYSPEMDSTVIEEFLSSLAPSYATEFKKRVPLLDAVYLGSDPAIILMASRDPVVGPPNPLAQYITKIQEALATYGYKTIDTTVNVLKQFGAFLSEKRLEYSPGLDQVVLDEFLQKVKPTTASDFHRTLPMLEAAYNGTDITASLRHTLKGKSMTQNPLGGYCVEIRNALEAFGYGKENTDIIISTLLQFGNFLQRKEISYLPDLDESVIQEFVQWLKPYAGKRATKRLGHLNFRSIEYS